MPEREEPRRFDRRRFNEEHDDHARVMRALSISADHDPAEMDRRRFLRTAAIGAGATAAATSGLVPGLGGRAFAAGGDPDSNVSESSDPMVRAAAASGPNILVLMLFGGGNDGLNTVIPTSDAQYASLRGALAIPAAQALTIAPGFGFHPSLKKLKERYDAGSVAIVRGVGYANPDLSHFTSMAYWMAGSAQVGPKLNEAPTNGWIGRYLDGLGGGPDAMTGVVMSNSVPLFSVGRNTRATALPDNLSDAFGADRRDIENVRMFDTVSNMARSATGLGPWGDALAVQGRAAVALATRVSPIYSPAVSDGDDLTRKMTLIARLINANLGTRVFAADNGGFDNHADQLADHAALLTDFDAAIQAFYNTLNPAFVDRVTIMTFSEFGRRVKSNDSAGTDHGAASCLFVIGSRVKGGMYGEQPSLRDLDNSGSLKANVDFRSVYATMLDGWLGADSRQLLEGSYPTIDLFRAAADPGGGVGAGGTAIRASVNGYWMVTALGVVHAFGEATDMGHPTLTATSSPVVAMACTPSRKGYWLVDAKGHVYPYGDAVDRGNLDTVKLAKPIVGIAATPTGGGYWLLGGDGGVFAFGDAVFYGSTGNIRLAKPVNGMCATNSGKGYWFCASDGGIFAYGDAAFYGSTGNIRLNQPVVGMAPTPSGNGYWLVATDGGIFAYGDAGFFGSTGDIRLVKPVIGMASTPSGKGYWLVASDGGMFAFGDATFFGSASGKVTGTDRVVGMAV